MKKVYFLLLIGAAASNTASAQSRAGATPPDTSGIALATEFSIPTAAAFTLLGNTPAQVTSPGFTKDVKLDYFLDGRTLKPNIAFQAQPVWLLGFQNISLQEYREMSPVLRALSRLTVSVGTVQDNDSVSRLAYAGRITFEKDPMMDRAYTAAISGIHAEMLRRGEEAALAATAEKFGHERAVRRLQAEQARLTSPGDDARLRVIADSLSGLAQRITALDDRLRSANAELNAQGTAMIDSFVQDYIARGWARPKLDVGFGAVNRYQSGASITRLGLAENGYGVWLNPSAGFRAFGRRRPDGSERPGVSILVTGIFRYTRFGENGEAFYGGNLRVGSAGVNVFAEYTRLQTGSATEQMLAYGGAYRIGNKKLLQFGIRTAYNADFRFRDIQPVVALDWKLGRDHLRDALRRD